MHLKQNSDKTDYIMFRSKQQPQKSTSTPLNANGKLVNLNEVVRYLGGYLDQILCFKKHFKEHIK